MDVWLMLCKEHINIEIIDWKYLVKTIFEPDKILFAQTTLKSDHNYKTLLLYYFP